MFGQGLVRVQEGPVLDLYRILFIDWAFWPLYFVHSFLFGFDSISYPLLTFTTHSFVLLSILLIIYNTMIDMTPPWGMAWTTRSHMWAQTSLSLGQLPEF